jgi:hypothetical protein
MNRIQHAAFAAAIAGGAGCVPHAQAWEATLNGLGQGTMQAQVWCAPNRPPQSPSIQEFTQNPPNIQIGPGLPLCGAGTRIQNQVIPTQGWFQHTQFDAIGGDTVDWHSMLPYVTRVAPTATGTLDVTSLITGPNTATFTVIWSGSNAGVAMHLGWFEGTTLLHEELRVGPWSETLTIPITSVGDIQAVKFESSGAAVTLLPCGSADFNCDGDVGTDADIAAFFSCLAGTCPPLPCTSTADFNGDGDLGTDADIEAFFRVLGGGTC